MIEKMRQKGIIYEEGEIRVTSLYGNIDPTFWKTICV